MNNKIIIYSILLISLVTFMNISQVASINDVVTKRNAKNSEKMGVFLFEQDDTINEALEAIIKNLGNSPIVVFESISQALKHKGFLILIGHGTEKGINSENGLLLWDEIIGLISKSQSNDIFLVSCYGKIIESDIVKMNKNFLGFEGLIDFKVASLITSIVINHRLNNNKWIPLVFQVIDRIQQISDGSILPKNLGYQNSESTDRIAVKYQYYQTGTWICFFGLCHYQTFSEENILWLNIVEWMGRYVKDAINGIGLISIITALMSGKKDTGFYIINKIIDLGKVIVNRIGTITIAGFTFTSTLIAGIIGILLFFMYLEFWWAFNDNPHNRYRGDYKVGLGAQYFPVPLLWIKTDQDDDRRAIELGNGASGSDMFGDPGWWSSPFPLQFAGAIAVFSVSPILSALFLVSPYILAIFFPFIGSNWIGV